MGVLFKNNPKFSDIVPVEQEDGPNPVVVIGYSEKFKDAHDYFRAILKSGEKSQRALEITTAVVNHNPANYTAWSYRRTILYNLELDLKEELQFITEIIQKEPKNYQVWFHRMKIVEALQDPSQELAFTQMILGLDCKNYHVWQYRFWILDTFMLWEGETAFMREVIAEDPLNNSAWNHLFTAITKTTTIEKCDIKAEIKYVFEVLSKFYENEAAWNYLTGIISKNGFKHFLFVAEDTEKIIEKNPSLRFPYDFLVSFYGNLLKEEVENKKSYQAKIISYCKILGEKVDEIRSGYWAHMKIKYESMIL